MSRTPFWWTVISISSAMCTSTRWMAGIRAPGAYDYRAVLEVLSRRGYSGWVSLEVFDFTAGADRIAVDSLRFLESEISKIS